MPTSRYHKVRRITVTRGYDHRPRKRAGSRVSTRLLAPTIRALTRARVRPYRATRPPRFDRHRSHLVYVRLERQRERERKRERECVCVCSICLLKYKRQLSDSRKSRISEFSSSSALSDECSTSASGFLVFSSFRASRSALIYIDTV